MSGRKSRNKGLNFEREIARTLASIWPNAKRHLENQAVEARGFDLDNTDPFRIQCKRLKQYAPISKLSEPICNEDEMPMLITKGDRTKTVVVMYLEDFIYWTNVNKTKQKIDQEK